MGPGRGRTAFSFIGRLIIELRILILRGLKGEIPNRRRLALRAEYSLVSFDDQGV